MSKMFTGRRNSAVGAWVRITEQIAEAHDGSLTLENRGAVAATGRRPGCTARVRLPYARG